MYVWYRKIESTHSAMFQCQMHVQNRTIIVKLLHYLMLECIIFQVRLKKLMCNSNGVLLNKNWIVEFYDVHMKLNMCSVSKFHTNLQWERNKMQGCATHILGHLLDSVL